VNGISCLSSSGLVIAMVVSLIFIVLLRYLAGIMIWVMIVMVILVIGYGIIFPFPETYLTENILLFYLFKVPLKIIKSTLCFIKFNH
jgi:hypothetical protein